MSYDNDEIKCVTSIFTIFFEDPFWIGVLEENYNGINYMGRHIFGAEPSNSELLQFYIYELEKIEIIKIGESIIETKKLNFKKSLNKSKKTQSKIGVGTKSQTLFQRALKTNTAYCGFYYSNNKTADNKWFETRNKKAKKFRNDENC